MNGARIISHVAVRHAGIFGLEILRPVAPENAVRDRRLAGELVAARSRGVAVRVTLEGRPRTTGANAAVITLLEEGLETGIIDATERVLIDNVLEASETDISRIMTPGPRIQFLDADIPIPELIAQFRSYQHPRVPVYQGHWDNVIGFIHSETILKLIRGETDLSIS